MTAYKGLKEDAKEIAKDLRTAKKWLDKTTLKLKKFNERDIFEEHDEVAKQIKELDKEVKFIGNKLGEAFKMLVENIKDVTNLYKHSLYLRKRIEKLEESQVPELFRRRLLGRPMLQGK